MTNRRNITALVFSCALLLCACDQPAQQPRQPQVKQPQAVEKPKPKERISPAAMGYQFMKAKEWWKLNRADSVKTRIVLAVNRTDSARFKRMDSVLVPNDLTGDIEFYLPFPFTVDSLAAINKIIFFSYPSQAFAAYEHGELVYTGQTNMGRKKDPTPPGLYFCNWKAEETISTVNDEWELKWNFNIENKEGIGFHQYELPGYPASHSCLRLTEKDAKFLYSWADQWILKGTDNVIAKGTPVVVFGNYDFGARKPWWQLVTDPKALDISAAQLEQLIIPSLNNIMQEQAKRENNTH